MYTFPIFTESGFRYLREDFDLPVTNFPPGAPSGEVLLIWRVTSHCIETSRRTLIELIDNFYPPYLFCVVSANYT